jgi:hypothetical protein
MVTLEKTTCEGAARERFWRTCKYGNLSELMLYCLTMLLAIGDHHYTVDITASVAAAVLREPFGTANWRT